MAIRNAAKAIILHNDKILANRCVTAKNEEYYDLPGGGQNQFETMEEAVIREVYEETGYTVKIVRFLALAEEIYDNAEQRKKYYDYSHRVLHIFLTELVCETCDEPTEVDFQQEESIWMSFDEIDRVNFHPSQLSGKFRNIVSTSYPQYLGYTRVD